MLKPYPRKEVGVYAAQFLPDFPKNYDGIDALSVWLDALAQSQQIVRWEVLLLAAGPKLTLTTIEGRTYRLNPGDYILADDTDGSNLRGCEKEVFEDLFEVS